MPFCLICTKAGNRQIGIQPLVHRGVRRPLRWRSSWANRRPRDEYPSFKFSYAQSKEGAFAKECKNYHDFGAQKASFATFDTRTHPHRVRRLALLLRPSGQKRFTIEVR
jgi:hypothetical protein